MTVQRSEMRTLVEEVLKYSSGFKTLQKKELGFIFDMNMQSQKYGFSFSEKQLGWLQNILKQLKEQVETK